MRHRVAGIVALTLCAALALAGQAAGKTYEVTKKSDPAPGKCKANDCSLREAISAANEHQGADKVELPSRKGAYKISIATTLEDANLGGDLDINGPLTVEHKGKGRATVDGKQIDRVFDAHGKAEFDHLRITRGLSESGSGIRSESGGLTVRDSVLDRNGATLSGAGITLGFDDKMKLINSRVEKNLASYNGGIDAGNNRFVIRNSRITGNIGGAMYGRIGGTIIGSTISGNSSQGETGGLEIDYGLTLIDSTISGNEGAGDGGGIENDFGPLRITNSTITGNRAGGRGGGIFTGANTAKLNGVTISRNVADTTGLGTSTYTGGLYVNDIDAGTINVENSIISGNTRGSATQNNCFGPITSLGHNLFGNGCAGITTGTDLASDNPGLAKLANNGGPTKTMALRKGSPAIGKAGKSSAPKRDQRGRKRDKHPDIGAFER